MPASAIAFAPAIEAASAKVTSCGHQRRSEMPARASSMPGWRPVRAYVSVSCSSISSEVTTMGASAAVTERIAVSRYR